MTVNVCSFYVIMGQVVQQQLTVVVWKKVYKTYSKRKERMHVREVMTNIAGSTFSSDYMALVWKFSERKLYKTLKSLETLKFCEIIFNDTSRSEPALVIPK